MGILGSGLWDNDSSLDALLPLVHLPAGKELDRALVSWGLRLWFAQCKPSEFSRGLERHSKLMIKLPKPLFEELAAIAQRPTDQDRKPSRRPEHIAILGSHCNGYRMEPIFTMPGARAIVEEVAERCALRLDRTMSAKKRVSLKGKHLTELGVLLELTNVGVYPTPERVEAWRAGFDEMNALTTEERTYWDEYCARVGKLFPLLLKPAKAAAA